ncbi:type II membrane protein [Lodderomyces elongisporus]|uniref:type II membrane protein n=1 Tax=Lodderomyces elongisporus TaxID=36914 RepID=UPI0029242359|nr:type II membrane protein [Lodderomyces elongisporus]WLF79705.1 type II membrane protein [Lodderomyces elongisporus]
MLNRLLIFITLALAVRALDCSAKELQQYNLESVKGTYSISNIKSTPPSKTNITWSIGICEPIKDVADCPQNSDVCGITSILIDGKSPVVSEIIGFNSNVQKEYETIAEGDGGIIVKDKAVNWGDSLIDAEIHFICDKNAKENDLKLDKWDGQSVKLSFKSKAACITSDKDKKKNNGNNNDNNKNNDKKKDNGESWGWFTWIFIFLVLFLSIYIVGGAWFQYNKGNAIDFQSALKEVIENFIDLLKSLPSFIREIIERFTGSSGRAEYSAV